MKFHAKVVIEFSVHDIGEAGKRLNELPGGPEERGLENRPIEPSTVQPRR